METQRGIRANGRWRLGLDPCSWEGLPSSRSPSRSKGRGVRVEHSPKDGPFSRSRLARDIRMKQFTTGRILTSISTRCSFRPPIVDPHIITEAILDFLRQAPQRRLPGALLGNKLQRHFGRSPREIGVGKLVDFVESHLANEVDIQRDGLLVTYSLRDEAAPSAFTHTSTPTSSASSHDPPDLWRIWRSPRSGYRLAVRHDDGSVRALDRDASPTEGETMLTPSVVGWAHRDCGALCRATGARAAPRSIPIADQTRRPEVVAGMGRTLPRSGPRPSPRSLDAHALGGTGGVAP